MMRNCRLFLALLVVVALVLATGPIARAATIAYVGSLTGTEVTEFYSQDVAKSLDADSDNRYGSDGWDLFVLTTNNPPYAAFVSLGASIGTTGPYNQIGTLLLGNAENAFLNALTQLINPGNPYLYALGPSRTNMRSGDDLYYTLEKVFWKRASVQLGQSYNLPVSAECGGTMTWRYDLQNGAEGMLFMLAACDSQASLLAGIGSCFNANGMSAEMMAVQISWLKAVEFLNRPIDEGALNAALESIKRVGPGGNFLADDLTLELLRSGEFFNNELFDYSGHHGAHPSLLEQAHGKVEQMIAEFSSPVPEQLQEDLRRYFHNQYRKLGVQDMTR